MLFEFDQTVVVNHNHLLARQGIMKNRTGYVFETSCDDFGNLVNFPGQAEAD